VVGPTNAWPSLMLIMMVIRSRLMMIRARSCGAEKSGPRGGAGRGDAGALLVTIQL
jgi:hypothetical protein